MTPAAGDEYFATDTGLTYKWNGTVWQTMLLAGAWQNLSITSGWSATSGYYTPAARFVGDRVELCGSLTYNSGGLSAFAQLPSAAYDPASNVQMAHPSGAASFVSIPGGSSILTVSLAAAPGVIVHLDGLSYRLI